MKEKWLNIHQYGVILHSKTNKVLAQQNGSVLINKVKRESYEKDWSNYP